MAWVESTINESTNAKMSPTMNGPSLMATGNFCVQYSTFTTTSTSEWSIISNQLAATAITNPLAGTSAPTFLNLADDPTGKSPASTVFLPGTASATSLAAPMGAFTLGTQLQLNFFGTFTAGGTMLCKLTLRNPVTGAVAYTLTDSNTYSPTASAVGSHIEFNLCMTGTNSITAQYKHIYGAGSYAAPLKVTTVDFTQNYVLDATITMGTSGTYVAGFMNARLVG